MTIRSRGASKQEIAVLLAISVGVLILGLYHLSTYPVPWFDEGWYLQVPRNLVLYGQYATQSSEGFRFDDTVLSVAPTLYLPISLVFKLAGIGWLQARLVMVVYLLLTAAIFYWVAREICGPTVAVAALYLLVFKLEDDPYTSTLFLGRQVMGEVPALGFFLLGCLLWFRALTKKRQVYSVVSGVLFGLAMITKLQFVFLIPPALLGTAVLAHLFRERIWVPTIAALVASVGCLLVWFLCLWLVLGPANFSAMIQDLRAASSPQVRVFSSVSFQSAVKFLLRSDFLVFGLAGLVYAVLSSITDRQPDVRSLFLLVFVVVGLAWFALGSVGWPRYAYPFLAVSNIFVAKALLDLVDGFQGRMVGGLLGRPRFWVIFLVLLALPVGSFRLIARDLLARPDRSLYELTQYVQAQIPPGAVIETWEWEVTLLDHGHRYHLPPTPLLNRMIAQVYLDVPYNPSEYDPEKFAPDYVIVGRFARWTGVYEQEFLEMRCRRLTTVGEYELFEVVAR